MRYKLFLRSACLLIILSTSILFCSCQKSTPVTKDLFAFDTLVNVTDYNGLEENVAAIASSLNEISDVFSSAYGVNANTLDNPYLSQCADKTVSLNQKYGNTVNITCGALTDLWGISTDSPVVPAQNQIEEALSNLCDLNKVTDFSSLNDGVMLDFGSVAKGFACDKVNRLLKSNSDDGCAIISLGSSTLLYGKKPDGSLFSAAIKNPDKPSEYLGIIKTSSAYISTSGGYERYFEYDGVKYEHIISTETGYPVETDLTSVTVIVPSDKADGGILSDFLSTAIYSEGTVGLKKYLDSKDFYVIAADKNKNIYISGGVDFTLEEKSEYTSNNG